MPNYSAATCIITPDLIMALPIRVSHQDGQGTIETPECEFYTDLCLRIVYRNNAISATAGEAAVPSRTSLFIFSFNKQWRPQGGAKSQTRTCPLRSGPEFI